MAWFTFRPDNRLPVSIGRPVNYNELLLERPFETATFTGGTAFSHGHFILNAGYSQSFDNIFNFEEPY